MNKIIILLMLMLCSGIVSGDDGDLFDIFHYRNIGPTRGGRVTAVEGVIKQKGTFYMGATGGGVWKTTDFGLNWKNISDGFFATPSIGAIAVVQSNPDIVYVGTGSDGIRSNVITGKGVYRSTNAGKSWKHVGLKDAGQIGAMEIHPNNPENVFVAAIGQAFQPNSERGVFRTEDGGKTWEKVLFIADTIGVSDIEFAPDEPNTVYASAWRAERKPWTIISGGKHGGIYKSTDGGDSWKLKRNGLPKGLIGKIDLAVSAADPDRLSAIVEAPGDSGGLYRSDDRGETFRQVSDRKELVNRPFYYTNLESNPLDADILFSNANRFMRSDDGGKTWRVLSTPHGDNHDIWIHPADTSLWIQSNDGGVNVTTNSGKTWTTQSNQSTAELYQVEVDDQYPYWLYAGQQDNTTISLPSHPPLNAPGGGINLWLAVGGCETGPAVPKPGEPWIVFSNCKGRFGTYDKRSGQERQYYVGAANIYGHNPRDMKFRFQRVAPIHVSPHDANTVYHASQYLHKTTDDGETWKIISPDLTAFEPDKQVFSGSPIIRDITGEENYSTIYSVRESPLKAGVIWVGANDGPVHVTRNGGKKWKNVTPKGLPPGGRVDAVEPSPHKPGKAYIAVLRYQLGDWKPYIYRTTNYGKNWTLLTEGKNGIPIDYPTRVVREDPDREGLLFVGTEFGLFLSFNDGESWKPFQQDLPVTPVTDIKVFRKDLSVSTMGRGFWMMDDISPLHQWEQITSGLFKPRDSYRYRARGSQRGTVPEYPSPSIIIDYVLNENPAGEISIDIRNSAGKTVRSYSSGTQSRDEQSTTAMGTGFIMHRGSKKLDKSVGTHRFRWDMRHKGAWNELPDRAFSNGPMAAPGTYTVTFTVNEKSQKQSFQLLADPRIAKSGVTEKDLKEQEKLALEVRDLLSRARKLAAEENSPKDALVTGSGPYPQPMLIDQIRYLASMIDQADQRPGKDAYDRFQELTSKLEKLSK
ncbi:MAG: hypothetical protein VX822_06130 [Candidatus Neomarinimicrobiota bacterium]|nr:hypothetical protein [Candidatus Neomarinimicrobiota bacterium]